MSKLDGLLKQYCPDSVEDKRPDKIARNKRSSQHIFLLGQPLSRMR